MSKTAPVSTVQREVKAGGHLLLYLVVGFVVLVVAGPSLLNSAADGVVSAAGRTAQGAVRNHTYPIPGPAGGWNGPSPGDTPPTTTPTPKPYGAPNGPVKPLPSQLPPPTIPPAKPDLPTLEGGGGGGILGELPGVGPIINELGPGLAKALTP